MATNDWSWPTGGDFGAGQATKLPTLHPEGYPYSTGGGFYNPDSMYGGDRDWASTPVISGPNGYLENNWDALYTRYIAPWASGNSPFAQWVQSRSGDVYQALQAAVASNPLITAQGFLGQLSPEYFAQQWFNRTPSQRGESRSMFGGGPLSWI